MPIISLYSFTFAIDKDFNALIDRERYPQLNLPAYAAKVRSIDGQIQIFDRFRKKYLQLTPEEWVRQHFVNYLSENLLYPKSRIQLEFGLAYNRRLKRPDILVSDDQANAFILVECKAPTIKLNENVFLQTSTYFSILKPQFLVMTNGMQHVIGKLQPESENFVYLKELPSYR